MLVLAVAGVTVASAGLVVAVRGRPERTWPLYMLAVGLTTISYAATSTIAEYS